MEFLLLLQNVNDVTSLVSTPWEKVTIVGILLAAVIGVVYYGNKILDKKDAEILRLNTLIAENIEERLEDIKEFSKAEAERQHQFKELTNSISLMLELFRNNKFNNGSNT